MLLPLLFWAFLLTSMIGWGRIAQASWLGVLSIELDWTMEAIWGLSLTCCFGSFDLALVPGSPKIAWWVWLILGFVYFAYFSIRARDSIASNFFGNWSKLRAGQLLLISIVLVSAFLMYLKAMSVQAFNCYDDLIAYIPEVRMILDRGDFSNPFSLRRLASYGGQSILQSFFVLPLKEYYVWSFERAFMLLLGAAFLFKRISCGQRRYIAASFLAILFLWADHPYINVAAELSGTVLLFGFMATSQLYEQSTQEQKVRVAVMLGVIACAFSQLRASNFASAVVLLAIPLVFELARKSGKSTLLWAVITLCFGLLPGAWMLYRSSGTPFFPVIPGNYDSSYGTFDTPDNIELFKYLKQIAVSSQVYALPILAWAILSNLRNRKWYLGLLCASIATLGTLAYNLRAIYDYHSVYRYAYAVISVMFFFTIAELLRTRGPWQIPRSKWEWNKVISQYAAIGLLSFFTLDAVFTIYDFGLVNAGSIAGTIQDGVFDPFEKLREQYIEVQRILPADGKIALAVEHPFLFDFGKTSFTLLDIPGCVSPGHGFKTELSPEQIDHYFLSQGIKYIVFEDPDKSVCQYSRAFWTKYKTETNVKDFHKYWYPHHLRFFEYLDWKRAHSLVTSQGRYYVVKIED